MNGGMNELALFAGAGGGLLASNLLGWNTVGAVELAKYPREVLMQRQRDGLLDQFPIWDDVCTFDGKPWRGLVDVVSGGFPCQDISAAGKGAGLAGARSGLWFEYLRIVDEIQPRYVFAENSPHLRTRGLGTVIEGLTGLGYDIRWGVLGAWHIGANHKRNRMWVLADSGSRRHGDQKAGVRPGRYTAIEGSHDVADSSIVRQQAQSDREIYTTPTGFGQTDFAGDGGQVPHIDRSGCEEQRRPITDGSQHPSAQCGGWWESEPAVGRVAHGVASRVDRLTAIGNGQVPAVAAAAFEILRSSFDRAQHHQPRKQVTA